MTDINLLVRDLQPEEGFKLIRGKPCLYDDANGHPVVPGYTLVGHPTGGYGFALDVSPLTQAESLIILTSRASAFDAQLQKDDPWIKELDEPRQRALADMAYNRGVHGLEEFTTFLALVKARAWDDAADDLMKTPWYSEVGIRGVRIVAVIRGAVA